MGGAVFIDSRLFCEGAEPILLDPGEHPIAGGEPCDLIADSDHLACELIAEHLGKLSR